jgi:hypothetical protein
VEQCAAKRPDFVEVLSAQLPKGQSEEMGFYSIHTPSGSFDDAAHARFWEVRDATTCLQDNRTLDSFI